MPPSIVSAAASPAHAAGHMVSPAHPAGHMVSPAHAAGHMVSPAHAAGHMVSPAHAAGHMVSPAHAAGHMVSPAHAAGHMVSPAHPAGHMVSPAHPAGRCHRTRLRRCQSSSSIHDSNFFRIDVICSGSLRLAPINNYDTMTWETISVLIDRRVQKNSPSFICTYKFIRYSV